MEEGQKIEQEPVQAKVMLSLPLGCEPHNCTSCILHMYMSIYCVLSVMCHFCMVEKEHLCFMLDHSFFKCLQGLCKSLFYQAVFSGLE